MTDRLSDPGEVPDPTEVAELYGEAEGLSTAEQQELLDRRSAGRPALRAEVESLLAAHRGAADFLERPQGEAAGGEDTGLEGQSIGPYRLRRAIGHGGMGTVYLAERADGGFEQQVALKLVRRGLGTPSMVERFLRERQILARLAHPHIARLLDGGLSAEGRPYFAMELVRGTPLVAHCDARRLSIPQRLALFAQACRAVQHAHANLVVHRDLKPSNMLVSEDGTLKLLDFGIARLLDQDGDPDAPLTRDGAHPLTPEYAAPEQVRGEPATTATDVYALGVVLYELLTGRRPFSAREATDPRRETREPEHPATAVARPLERREGDSRHAVTPAEVATARATTPRRLRRLLAGDLSAIVLQALCYEPERRYPSVEALAADLERHRAGLPVRARPATLPYRLGKLLRRHRVAAASATAAGLALLGGTAVSLWQADLAARQRDAARLEAARATAVQSFLVELFESADPVQAKGDAITARELLEHGVARLERELASQPAVQRDLLGTVARIYFNLGRYDRGKELAERELALARRLYPAEHLAVAQALNDVANAHVYLGAYDTAEPLYRQALQLHRRLAGPRSAQTAGTLNDLALLHHYRGELDTAEALYREALALRRAALGDRSSDVATTASNLGSLLWTRGRLEECEALFTEALATWRALDGEQHPNVAYALGHLALVARARGALDEAERLHRQALAIERRSYGEEHEAVSARLNNLSRVLHERGSFGGAEALLRQVLAIDRKTLGEEHPYIAVGLDNLASAIAEQGRGEEALALFERALALHRRQLGPDHHRTGSSLLRQADTLAGMGRLAAAVPLAEEGLRVLRAKHGEQHAEVAGALLLQGRLRMAAGDHAGAEASFRQALAIQRAVLPAAHADTAWTLVHLGEALLARGAAAAAATSLREALAMAERTLPVAHWRRAAAQSALGAALRALGQEAAAQPLLLAGHAGLRDARGADHPLTRRAHDRLAAPARRAG